VACSLTQRTAVTYGMKKAELNGYPPDGEKVIKRLAVSTECCRVTDGQTSFDSTVHAMPSITR